ncbi:methyltransferase domain-containing protein [Candidatus Bipolaricaulota bacterium]|nr:methyltransferase domain-containing protein [Candidatus Bipolaricaulota bacterium]
MRIKRYGRLSSTIYSWLIDPLLAPLRPKIARLCLKYDLDPILDIGTATGAQCRTLAAAGIHAVGLDLSEAMIAAAKARPSGNIEYVVGSAYELPFPDASFHAVLLSLALHEHSEEERTRMLAEAMRVLESDGHLILVEYSRPARTHLHIPWFVIQLIENMAGGDHRAGFRQFMAMDGLEGLLRRHNLRATEIVYSHFHTLAIAIIAASEDLESSTPIDVA